MAGTDAIADVGDTLVSLLRDAVAENTTVALATPAEFDPDTAGLSLFLYDVSENAHLANEREPVTDDDTRPGDPLVLELSYLLTAHPSPDDTEYDKSTGSKDYHGELGKAMRALRDNSIVSGSALKGSLGDDDRLHVSMESRTTDQLLNVWGTFQETPYLPSVSYVVTPVIIESDREQPVSRVEEAEFRYDVRTGR